MTKEQLLWLKKLFSLSTETESYFKKDVILKTEILGNEKKLIFKINSFLHTEIFLILQDLKNKLHKKFSLIFVANSNNLSGLTNDIEVLLNIKDNSLFEVVYENKKYHIIFKNEALFNEYNNLQSLDKLEVLGINNDELFSFLQEEEIIKEEKHEEKQFKPWLEGFNKHYLYLNKFEDKEKELSISKIVDDVKLIKSKVITYGEIFSIQYDFYEKSKMHTFKFYISDHSKAICIKKIFSERNNDKSPNLNVEYLKQFKEGDFIKTEILLNEDNYEYGDVIGSILKILPIKEPDEFIYKDDSNLPRIELNFHSNMSAFDGLHSPEQIIKFMKKQNIKALSINDFNSVQSFPSLYRLASKEKLDLIYGCEFSFAKKNIEAVYHAKHIKLSDIKRFVFFDLETTGLAPNYDEIIEFGAYFCDYHQVFLKDYQSFIHATKSLDKRIIDLTRITNKELENAPNIKDFLLNLHEVIKEDDVLIAHNGIDFDIKFLNSWCRKCNVKEFKNVLIDTLVISRAFLNQISTYNLGRVSRFFNFEYNENVAHRADADALYLNNIFWKLIDFIPQLQDSYLDEWNELIKTPNLYKRTFLPRIILQSKYKKYDNKSSINILYNLVSKALTDGFNDHPILLETTFEHYKKWFFYTNSAVDGELFEYAIKEDDNSIVQWMKQFDYLQIAPLYCYKHLFKRYTEDIVKSAIVHIIELAKKNNILMVATSNAFYIPKYYQQFHRIYILTKSIGNKFHRYLDYRNDPLVNNVPDLYVRNTKELEDEMLLLINDNEYVHDLVVNNAYKIYDQIDKDQIPIQLDLFPPYIEGVDDKLKDFVYNSAKQKYGENLPKEILDRLDLELNIIIKKGYSVVYWISHLLVKQSLDDGFLVGSRGSVGSSLVATFLNITEINPLKAHYYCTKCHYFKSSDYLGSGYDLPKKNCPNCNEVLKSDGQNIPFATFLGFDGDKVPDIDLNFSGLYQANAHLFIRNMFGKEHAFRAGTIATVAEKTAYGYVNDFIANVYNSQKLPYAQKRWWAVNCMNVKRTTGQHPGGIVIVPQEKTVFDFTPYNYPADDDTSDWYTTHFDFENIHDNLLKFDILGHDDPTVLKYLKDITNIDPRTIPTNDEKVISLFTSLNALDLDTSIIKYKEKNAALGLPEFGTRFVREMLNEAKPENFSDLIRISGLSHGTDVWANNQQIQVKEGKKLNELVTCRDDIMTFLSSLNIEPKTAFKIMEDIRKGKGLKPEYEQLLIQHKVPQWYLNACKKIVYLFPKAHATAYVLSAWRIAWFKVYYPLAYYATYFSVRCEVFDIKCMKEGAVAIFNRLNDIKQRLENKETANSVTKKEQDLYAVLEVALEMCLRGYSFSNIDLKRSDATLFQIDAENKTIIPPFIVLDGLGKAVADSIIQARKEHEFISIQDFKDRTRTNKTLLDKLTELNVFDNLNDDNQLTFNF